MSGLVKVVIRLVTKPLSFKSHCTWMSALYICNKDNTYRYTYIYLGLIRNAAAAAATGENEQLSMWWPWSEISPHHHPILLLLFLWPAARVSNEFSLKDPRRRAAAAAYTRRNTKIRSQEIYANALLLTRCRRQMWWISMRQTRCHLQS